MFDSDKSPYPVPTHPFLWKAFPEHKMIRLEMDPDLDGNRRIAQFEFDSQPNVPGFTVHVAVWLMKASIPEVGDMATPLYDTRLHNRAHMYFNLTLLNAPGTYSVIDPEEPSSDPPVPQTNRSTDKERDDLGEPVSI